MGMQGLSRKTLQSGGGHRRKPGGFGLEAGAVEVIAQERVPDMGEGNPDLMRAAGLQPACEQAGDRLLVRTLIPLQDLPMRDGGAATLAYGHFVARARIAVDGTVDGAAWPVGHPPDKGEIAPAQGTRAAVVGK